MIPAASTWAPDVLERARDHGLLLMESGELVDTAAGQVPDPDARPQAPASLVISLQDPVVHLDDAALRG